MHFIYAPPRAIRLLFLIPICGVQLVLFSVLMSAFVLFFDGIFSICGLLGGVRDLKVSEGLRLSKVWYCGVVGSSIGIQWFSTAQAGNNRQFLKYVAYSSTETMGKRRRSAEHDSEVQCVALIGSRHSLHNTTAYELRVCRGTHEEKVSAGLCWFSRT